MYVFIYKDCLFSRVVKESTKQVILDRLLDCVQDFLIARLIHLEIVSAELDPKTGLEKEGITGNALRTRRLSEDNKAIKYEATIEVPVDFGDIGAVLVENVHHKEMYLEDIVLDGFPNGPVNIICRWWVHSKFDNPTKSIFFTSKV
ncbi:Lipoxygenase [Parasponia andersonii]|uniref:Lipoxygenase n=1 Tax=Parasponia andersonii TaxID=3476 RepID=A0A2P5D8V6_PARAD|nr:Lipoxygenase [Parasponia andersonii]